MKRAVLSGACVAMLAVMSAPNRCYGQAATVFFSEATTVGGGASLGNPNLTVAAGQTVELGVWVAAPISLTIDSVAVDIVESAGLLTADTYAIAEAGNWFSRWNQIIAGTKNASPNSLVTDYDVIGGDGLVGGIWRAYDANYDDVAGAFLFGVLKLTAGAAVGDTDLYFKVGSGLIGYDSTETDIYFGDGDVAVNRTVAGSQSASADATIHVVPEPSAMGALALAGLAALCRRRRRGPPVQT